MGCQPELAGRLVGRRIELFFLFCYSKDKIKEKIEKSCDDMLKKCKICYESFCSFT